MNHLKKVLHLLGLSQRSGKLASGEFMVEKAVKEGRARLVILAADASDNTKKKFYNMGTFYQVPVLELSAKDELGHCIGRAERSSLALLDDGFAKAVRKELESYSMRR
jgi:ribosomal protein L7Ae-like RNA K-turn-binding protein